IERKRAHGDDLVRTGGEAPSSSELESDEGADGHDLLETIPRHLNGRDASNSRSRGSKQASAGTKKRATFAGSAEPPDRRELTKSAKLKPAKSTPRRQSQSRGSKARH